MDIAIVIAVGRVIERLLIVFVAGLALWFGFKLFQITANDTSSGEITYQHLRLRLTKVAPGIFFALFGCGLLGYSIVSVAVVPIEAANTNSTPRPPALYVFEPNPSSGVPPALASLNTIHQIAVQFRSGGELTNETRQCLHQAALQLLPLRGVFVDQKFGQGSFAEFTLLNGQCVMSPSACNEYLAQRGRREWYQNVYEFANTTLN